MLSFGTPDRPKRVLALADISSSGARLALVVSNPELPRPTVIWSHFEAFPVSYFEKGNEKKLQSAVRGAISKLELDGMRFLLQNFPDLKPELFKVTVASPLSETIARTIKFSGRMPIELNTTLADQLTENGAIKTSVPGELIFRERLGFTIAPGPVVALGKRFHQLVSILPSGVYDELLWSKERFLPNAQFRIEPQIGNYLSAINDLAHSTDYVCLLDVSLAATELCIVAAGQIRHITSISFGTERIISELAAELGLPHSEAAHFLKDNDVNRSAALSERQRNSVDAVYKEYERELSRLFQKGGYSDLPEMVFVRCDLAYLPFIKDRMHQIGVFNQQPTIHPITPELFDLSDPESLPISVTAYLFHRRGR